MNNPKIRNGFAPVVSVVVLIVVWEILGRGGNPLLSSHPSAIIVAFADSIASGELVEALRESLGALAVGYLLAVLIGVPLGIFFGRYQFAERSLGFYFVGLDSAPLVTFIPLYILWFGLGFGVKVAIIVTFSITPIIINTWMGVRGVPKTLSEVGKAFCASEFFVLRRIMFPSALPSIVTGLRLGVGRAVIALAVAELFTAITGLGGMLLHKSEDYDTAGMFVSMIVFMALGVGITVFIGWLERRAMPWHHAAAGHGDD
ncbi:MAG: ABC transporter permease [Rhodospirillum sp.]|nr:ABC transporter permease [Rhodospirillum sp.]MCF8489488.1 ABC transporter permease [Rhodospirillum sp.]